MFFASAERSAGWQSQGRALIQQIAPGVISVTRRGVWTP
jgi:hypothetical protein